VDFTAAPSRAKPIIAAVARILRRRLVVERIERLVDFAAFERLLAAAGPWHGGFDFPFGQPRAFVAANGWPMRWPRLARHLVRLGRPAFEAAIYTFMRPRPAGQRLLHRATDRPAGSSSPMQLAYVPVGKMFYEGALRLAGARVTLPGMQRGDPARVAVEAYPGLVARTVLGRESYKNDPPGVSRRPARARLVAALRDGALRDRYGYAVELNAASAAALTERRDADALDAVLAALQAAWSASMPGHGLPARFDRLEGWIVDPETLR
jgi:hypothetical protein